MQEPNGVKFHNNDAQNDGGMFENLAPKAKDMDRYEVDLKPHVKVIGMPNPNVNHNTSTEC